MSLSMALNSALSGLKASQTGLSVTSGNIANANTVGYSRQVVNLSSQYIDGQTSGVLVESITRQVDNVLQNSIRNQLSRTGDLEIEDDYLQRIQILLGEPGSTNSIDEYFQNFFDSMQSLAEFPESTSFRETAVNSAITLSNEISGLAEELEELRFEADKAIESGARDLTNLLDSLFNINIATNRAYAMGLSTAALEDERDLLLEDIAKYLDINAQIHETGEVSVYTSTGVALLDTVAYTVEYKSSTSVDDLINDNTLNALKVFIKDEDGNITNTPAELISEGNKSEVTTILKHGKFLGLHNVRDVIIPDILAQLDELAATLREEMNILHNNGSAYPPPSSLTGTRLVNATDKSDWSGSVMIAVLDQQGNPVPSAYDDELDTGFRPLTLDLSSLDSGTGAGQPTIQTIIDEINNHFGAQPFKTSVGNLNNIMLVSNSDELPVVPAKFEFDFELENISGNDADFFVSNVTVLDDGANDITAFNSKPPYTTLDSTGGTITTTAGSGNITIAAAGHSFAAGDIVYLSDPGTSVGGIPATSMTGYFEIVSVTSNNFVVKAKNAIATSSTSANISNMTATPKWDTINAGSKTRIKDAGTFDLDLTGNSGSEYYDIQVTVGVDDGQTQGDMSKISTATITYRIYNNTTNLLNDRFSSSSVSGEAKRLAPNTNINYIKATLVDENGNELPKEQGIYKNSSDGFLKLETGIEGYTIAIEELDSKQLGITSTEPQEEGTNRGFSHYFELNNFFKSNVPTKTGDTIEGSAIQMAVEDRFVSNSNLMSLGNLELSAQPIGDTATPLYTYERSIGNNKNIQKIAEMALKTYSFDKAGGLDASTRSFNGYIGEILAFNATIAAKTTSDARDANIILDGFIERSDSFKSVNVDEELANTIIFQQAYTASAKVINTTKEMFDALMSVF